MSIHGELRLVRGHEPGKEKGKRVISRATNRNRYRILKISGERGCVSVLLSTKTRCIRAPLYNLVCSPYEVCGPPKVCVGGTYGMQGVARQYKLSVPVVGEQ